MSDISSAIRQICDEKGLSYDAVVNTIESALAAAYRKDFGQKNQNIVVEFDPETSKSKVFDVKMVVDDLPEEELIEEGDLVEEEKTLGVEKKEDDKEKKEDDSVENKDMSGDIEDEEEVKRFNPKTELQISDAKLIKKSVKIGDEMRIDLPVPDEYGRMAAQTAKQVIIQRLREAERDMVFNDFKDKEHEVVSGIVQRREGRVILVDLDKTVGVILPDDQIPGEKYNPGDRIKVYVKEVSLKARGPEILLSRTSEEILRKIFYLEIPEISNGLIELKGVAREAGFRSKVAVSTDSENVDPIGSCVGQRGARIQTIISELGGEKVDIIEYNEDPSQFISNALSPAKVINIDIINADEKKAVVKVAGDQLSLAIGKGGQNARLAAKLTGWRIDIVEMKSDKPAKEEMQESVVEDVEDEISDDGSSEE